MKTAIINSDYQIIREKVIINRHPKAKNLKEALELETESNILGEPITLEDILNLLNHQPWKNRGWIESFGITETVNKAEYHINIYDKDYCSVGLCFWQLKKPLHQQSPETWKDIAKVVNKLENK